MRINPIMTKQISNQTCEKTDCKPKQAFTSFISDESHFVHKGAKVSLEELKKFSEKDMYGLGKTLISVSDSIIYSLCNVKFDVPLFWNLVWKAKNNPENVTVAERILNAKQRALAYLESISKKADSLEAVKNPDEKTSKLKDVYCEKAYRMTLFGKDGVEIKYSPFCEADDVFFPY